MCTKCISKSPFGHFSRWVRGGRGLQPAAAARHPITFAQRGEKWEVDYNTRATLCRWAPLKTICTRLHDASQSFLRATACGWKFLTHIDVENISHTRVCARKHTHTHVSQLPVCYCKWTTLCFSLSLSLTHPRVHVDMNTSAAAVLPGVDDAHAQRDIRGQSCAALAALFWGEWQQYRRIFQRAWLWSNRSGNCWALFVCCSVLQCRSSAQSICCLFGYISGLFWQTLGFHWQILWLFWQAIRNLWWLTHCELTLRNWLCLPFANMALQHWSFLHTSQMYIKCVCMKTFSVTHTHTHTNSCACAHTHTHKHTHKHTLFRTKAHTHTQKRTHTHTYTRTHSYQTCTGVEVDSAKTQQSRAKTTRSQSTQTSWARNLVVLGGRRWGAHVHNAFYVYTFKYESIYIYIYTCTYTCVYMYIFVHTYVDI